MRTRYKELDYFNDDANLWRIYTGGTDDGSAVGPHYRTKAELLADLDRFAAEFGCEDAQKAPEPETIDLTPTWQATMRIYMAVLENPKAEAHSLAAIRADLLRLARWVDKRQAKGQEVDA